MKSSEYRDFGGLPAQARFTFVLEPLIEHVVQVKYSPTRG